MSMPKATLIAGFPNSGTTITSMILGQHPAAFVAGELADFPNKRHFIDYNTCSCGQKTAECGFWVTVRDRYLEGPPDDARLYRLIAEQAGSQTVIDVAHDAERVEQLLANPGVDLQLIHVVRHRHAVLNSRARRLYRRGIISAYGSARVQKIVKRGRRHQQFLARMARATGRLGERSLEVDYDQLCREPGKWLTLIGDFMNLDYSAIASELTDGQPLRRAPHLIRGNGQLRSTETVVLRGRDEFRHELSTVDQWLYEAGVRLARLGVSG